MQMPYWSITFLVIFLRIKFCVNHPLDETTEKEIRTNGGPSPDLTFNFTFPPEGLPPMKLNLGNVMAYLTEKPDYSPAKKVVVMNIANPNKPYPPSPSGDIAKPCRSYIFKKCNDMCSNTRTNCRSDCYEEPDCLRSCQNRFGYCSQSCSPALKKVEGSKGNDYQLYLPKCLRNCKNDTGCINQCHMVCHQLLDRKPQPYGAQSNYQQSTNVQVVNVNPKKDSYSSSYLPSSTYKPTYLPMDGDA